MFLEGLKNKDGEVKRGPGRPRRYPSAQEEGGSETKPIELNIVSYQAEASEPQKEKKKSSTWGGIGASCQVDECHNGGRRC